MHQTKKSFNLTPSPHMDEGELRSKRVCPGAEVGLRTKNWNSAFTLVELIVVIVILAILSTIAFLSFNSYSAGARDSVRLGDLNNISKGLVLFYTNSGRYPIPDNYITITASGTNIGYQGYAGLKTLGIINLSNGGKDPLDTNTYYTYNTNINQNKYQLMGFLEDGSNSALSYVLDGSKDGDNNGYGYLGFNGDSVIPARPVGSTLGVKAGIFHLLNYNNISSFFDIKDLPAGRQVPVTSTRMTNDGIVLDNSFLQINQTYSDSNDYSKRYPYTKGDQLGILLNSGTQLPVQYNNSNTGFELTSATGTNYIAHISKSTIINSTGSMIGGLAGFYTVTQASSTYPGCDTPDIKLSNGQVWAACNVGASRAFNGINPPAACTNSTGCTSDPYPTMRNTLGSYFQWGRNTDITTATGQVGAVSSETNSNYYYAMGGTCDWLTTKNDSLWGGSGTTVASGTYLSLGLPSTMKGPCASGYHMPTTKELCDGELAINPLLICSNSWLYDKTVSKILKLPLAGFRFTSDANYYHQGNYGFYRTSSPSDVNSFALGLLPTQVDPSNINNRSNGFSVRCIRN